MANLIIKIANMIRRERERERVGERERAALHDYKYHINRFVVL